MQALGWTAVARALRPHVDPSPDLSFNRNCQVALCWPMQLHAALNKLLTSRGQYGLSSSTAMVDVNNLLARSCTYVVLALEVEIGLPRIAN